MQSGLLIAAVAYARTRWLSNRLRTRADLAAYQARRLAALLAHARRQFPHYAEIPGATSSAAAGAAGPYRLCDFPIVDKQALLGDFAGFNRAGLTLEAVRATLARGEERIAGHVVGQSTGTSGNRGYYVIGEAERFRWLGTMLAKALPDALWRRHKVALALPGLSRLYRSASTGSRIQLAFFDLAQGVDAWRARFAQFDPDTVVAPPKVLRRLAELGLLHAQNVFSGAEVLDPLDREVIEGEGRARVREIYMATEGLFGVACPHGHLHLAEDAVHFEWEVPAPGSALRLPLVTDFTRRAQAMIRYRMNDLLSLSQAPCPCGSVLQRVERIEGRQDDVFWLRGADDHWAMVTPDVVRNAIVDASPAVRDFRAIQLGESLVRIELDKGLAPGIYEKVVHDLRARLVAMQLAPVEIAVSLGIAPAMDRKLRRVRREWSPPAIPPRA
jgi:putative adenylate-forming enzyme